MSDKSGNENGTEEWAPTPKQRIVLEIAAQGEKTSITAICKEAKIDRKTIYTWFKNADFMKAWNDTWTTPVERQMPPMMAAQIKKALKGNTFAFQALLNASGKMIKRVDVTSGGEPLHIVGIEVVKPDGDA